jgi:phage tail sheath gpL-like
MLPAGSAAANVPQLVTSLRQAGVLWGVGSMIYQMVEQYYLSDTFGELWAVGLTDPSGVAATGTITVVAATPSSGLIALYIGGRSYPTVVQAGDSATAIAARLVSLVTADANAMVTAAATAGVVTVTAKHIGLLGNDIDIRLNYLGAAGGEFAVPGVTTTIVPMASGAGVPVLTTLLANLGTVTYDYVGCGYSDTATLNALDAFFNFGTGRWSWQSMLYGGYFTAVRGTPGALATFGTARNGPNGSVLGFFDSPDPCWVIAADYTAACAVSLRQDPNVPLQNIIMGFKSPPITSGFTRSIRNTMLYDGISTYTISRAGQVILERAITFYQTNPQGIADNAYLDVETLYGTAKLIRDWQAEMIRLYPRFKLFEDGNAIPAGQRATTAQQIRLATVAWYRREVDAGNAQDGDQFAAATISQNAGNGLVKSLLPFILPQQLRQIAGLAQFTKP